MKYCIENIDFINNNKDLYISGWCLNNDYRVIITCNKKKVVDSAPNIMRDEFKTLYNNYKENTNYGFRFTIENVSPHSSLKIYIVTKSSEQIIYKTKDLYVRKRLRVINKKVNYIANGFKILWKKHHFIVTPKILKEYSKKFYHKVILNELNNSNYYNPFNTGEYNQWLKFFEKAEPIEKFKYNPLISIVMPVYNVPISYLNECIDSVLNQTYDNFELCIADDCSTNEDIVPTLKSYEKKDNRIKVVYRKQNGHISEATNSAIKIANGEFIALLDNDDILSSNALYEVVKALNKNNKIDMIYSDEDKINLKGVRCDPHFKADWSPDTLLSHNYICHFTVLRKKIIEEIGGFRKGYEGSQDYDLFLRFTEKTNRIYHIPKVLYHWRMIKGSTSMDVSNKNYASINGIKSLESAMERRKIKANIKNIYTSYIIKYELNIEPFISIIIPTKDKFEMLNGCINSIYNKSTYKNFEIIIINNNSEDQKTFDGFKRLKEQHDNLIILDDDKSFNYSELNNFAVKHANGDYILLLNNDIEVITPEWLEIMVGYAAQDHIGAVGPKLLFADGKIQHAGVVVGVGEGHIANHAYYLEDRYAPSIAGRLLVPYNYSAVTGACLMVSKKKYDEVGGLDEQLKVNYNDIDFCMKLINKGYYNVFLPQIELYHYESQSRGIIKSKAQQEEYEQARDLMKDRWGECLLKDRFYNPNYSNDNCFVLSKEKVIEDEK